MQCQLYCQKNEDLNSEEIEKEVPRGIWSKIKLRCTLIIQWVGIRSGRGPSSGP